MSFGTEKKIERKKETEIETEIKRPIEIDVEIGTDWYRVLTMLCDRSCLMLSRLCDTHDPH